MRLVNDSEYVKWYNEDEEAKDMKGSLVPCGHTFSDFQIYDEKTAKEECIKMVRNIMEYWKAEAARIEQEQIL